MPTWALALVALAILVLPCAAFYLWFKVFNGPDGERFQKLRMQGPFVPLSDADIQAGQEPVRSQDDQKARTR